MNGRLLWTTMRRVRGYGGLWQGSGWLNFGAGSPNFFTGMWCRPGTEFPGFLSTGQCDCKSEYETMG